MAVVPPQPDPRDIQRLIDLYQQVDRLNQSQAESMARIAASAGNINKEINRLDRELNSVSDSFSSIAQSLKDSVQEFSRYNTTASNTKKTFSSLQSIASKLLSDQSGYSRLSEKELKKLQEKIGLESENLKQNLASGNLTEEQAAEAEDVLKRTADLTKLLEKRLDKEKEITKATGVTGNALKALSKIPGIGGALNTEEAIEDMKDLADDMKDKGEDISTFSNRLKIAGAGLKTAFKGIKDSLTDPVSILIFFTTKALEANKQTVELGKSLGYGVGRADAFRERLVGIERASNNLNVNTKNLVEAFSELSQVTGFAYEFSADQLTTQIKLTKQVGLQADEAAQIQRIAILNGKTSEETYKSFVRGLTATRNQLKVGINFKATLAEALKVSGQLAAQLGFNPERIAKAIVTAKAFGMTLEQVAKSGESLLNFEQSIDSELKAELLTSKQLNLERARAAALAGDQVALAEELAKNVGTAAEFTKMNKLQQQALAESVGMTADELAETLRKREEAIASGKSLVQIQEEEAQQALERQAVQDKFTIAIEKLQSLIGNLVAGPLGSFLDLLSGALNIVNKIGNALSFLATPLQIIAGLWVTIKGIQLASLATTKAITFYEGLKRAYVGAQVSMATGYNAALLIRKSLLAGELAKTIAIAAAWSVANPIKALLGLGAAAAVSAGLYALLKGPSFAEGGIVTGEINNATVGEAGPEAIIPLNSPKADKMLGGGGSIDLTPMIAAINEVKVAVNNLVNRPVEVSLDGKRVGSGLTQGSYKVA